MTRREDEEDYKLARERLAEWKGEGYTQEDIAREHGIDVEDPDEAEFDISEFYVYVDEAVQRVIYAWSEDGEQEICDRREVVTRSQTTCYHCDNSIKEGSAATELETVDGYSYLMHRACADKGCV